MAGRLPGDLEVEPTRALLSDLLERSRLYKNSKDFKDLLAFVVALGNMAPFNALLLQIQKPGLRFAASAFDWKKKFSRTVKEGARPLLIMWPFGPVAMVYDVVDTHGPPLPPTVVDAFRATGPLTASEIAEHRRVLRKSGINVELIEYGDAHAGHVGANPPHKDGEDRQGQTIIGRQSTRKRERPKYEIRLNAKHAANVQFATLAHELAHLFLGHLGEDAYLSIPKRPRQSLEIRELEAEAVSYLVCRRRGVDSRADAYLSGYVTANTTIKNVDLYAIARAAGHVETALDIAPKISFEERDHSDDARSDDAPRSIFYSSRHSLSLACIYSEMFGAPIPDDVARAAAANGTLQDLMAAVDKAAKDKRPIKDWTPFANASRHFSETPKT